MGMWIGRNRKARVTYGFDDIALVPGTVTINPNEVDTSFQLGSHKIHVPILASAMDGVVDVRFAVEMGKLAVDTGLVVLYEVEAGAFRLTGKSASLAKSGNRKPVTDYLATQSRFRGVTPQAAEEIQTWVDERWAGYLARHDATQAAGA